MEAWSPLGLLVVLVVVLAGLAVVLLGVLRRPAAAWLAAQVQARADAQADATRDAVDDAVATLRADREADVARTVETVLALAGDKLGTQLSAGQQHLDGRNEAIARQLDHLGGELRRVNDVVVSLQRERAEQHGQLLSGLRETIRHSQSVVSTTQSLREALSSTKARGQWGERMADDVLRLAGFVEGVNYRRQTATVAGTIPDFTFLLPGDWLLHMDVKFPIDNYLRHLQATTEVERRAAAQQFGRDVRERVRSLAGRGYVESGVTLDYVLLFIPNEATYGFLHENDPHLADFALGQKVVLCSPFTLFAVLGVVRQAVDSFALQRSTDEILEVLAGFTAQWDKFADAMDSVGRRLDSTAKAWDELSGTRRRQLQRMVDRVDDLRHHAPATPTVGSGSAEGPGSSVGPVGPVRVGSRRSPDADAPPAPVPLPRPEPAHADAADTADVRSLARRLTG
jgi:DNA recombination protein RmuC